MFNLNFRTLRYDSKNIDRSEVLKLTNLEYVLVLSFNLSPQGMQLVDIIWSLHDYIAQISS